MFIEHNNTLITDPSRIANTFNVKWTTKEIQFQTA